MKRILRVGRNCSDIVPQRRAAMVVDGEAYYRAFYEAALRARRSILLVGWQFDTEVQLLRGVHAERAGGDVRLLPFLNALCERNPDLTIHVLAWDYSFIYALEREWLQQVVFSLKAHPRIVFKLDAHHPIGASHHQKYVVVDGELAFVGGMDLCEHRWDDRCHKVRNPRRTKVSGLTYNPFHDVQGFISGREACAALVRTFKERWAAAGGEPAQIRMPDAELHQDYFPPDAVEVVAGDVAVSQTLPRYARRQAHCCEIRALFADAIMAADELLYIETQYISARAMEEALVRRMMMRNRPLLDIVVVLPEHPGEIKERFAVGLAQAKLLSLVREVAESTGHRLGIYYCVDREGTREVPTYIHSKVMVVDDRFFTVGSANMTNRSMGVDSEMHLSWEADTEQPDPRTLHTIRHARMNLLAEHTGLTRVADLRLLGPMKGLVERMDALAKSRRSRLRLQQEVHAPEVAVLPYVDMDALTLFDPDEPIAVDEEMGEEWRDFFAGGIDFLSRKLQGG